MGKEADPGFLTPAQGVLATNGMADIAYSVPIAGATIAGFESQQPVVAVLIEPAGTLATLTVQMPLRPKNGQVFALCSTQVITALTLTASAGTTILGAATALAVNTPVKYMYCAKNKKWFVV